MNRRSPRRPALLALGALGALAAACAKIAPPPGGPEDRVAPALRTDAITPAPGAAGVAPDSVLRIVFDEPMDQRSVMRSLAVFPETDFREVSWRGETLHVAADPGWPTERNTLLRIGTGARDRRGNTLEKSFHMHFTTKAVADSGVLRGRVWAGREMIPTAALLVFALPADTVAGGAEPASLADAEADGTYRLEGLDTAAAWRVAALVDRDGDARPGGRDDAWAVGEAVMFPEGLAETQVPDFLVGTLDSVGRLRGEVRADSGQAAVVLARRADVDTSWSSSPLPGGGTFSIDVPTGAVYRASAFLDLDGDGRPSGDEPLVEHPDPVRLDLAAERAGLAFDLRGLAPPPAATEPAPVEAAPPDSSSAPPDSLGIERGDGGEEAE